MTKFSLYFLAAVMITCSFLGVAEAQGWELWELYNDALLPMDAEWEIGSSTERIKKLWAEDANISGIFTLEGVVGTGGIDLNGNPLILDTDGNTQIIADTDDVIDIDIGGVASEYQFTATQLDLGTNDLTTTGTITDGTLIITGGSITDATLVRSTAFSDGTLGIVGGDLATTGTGTFGTQVTTPLIETAGTTDTLSIQPDATGDGTLSVKLFENAATGDRSKLRLYGYQDYEYSGGAQLRYTDIYIDYYGRLTFGGTAWATQFSTDLAVSGYDMNLTLGGRYNILFTAIQSYAGAVHSLRSYPPSNHASNYIFAPQNKGGESVPNDFGYPYTSASTIYLRSSSLYIDNEHIKFQHTREKGIIETGVGDLVLAPASDVELVNFGAEKVTNGGIKTDTTGWTLGAGWTLVSKAISHTSDGTAVFEQDVSAVAGETYEVAYTLIYVTGTGTVTASLGGTTGVTRTAEYLDQYYTERITATDDGNLTFTPSNTARLAIKGISVRKVTGANLTTLGTLGAGATTVTSLDAGSGAIATTGTISDGVLTISNGSITGMGNITGTDVDISAGTGRYSGTGQIQLSNGTISINLNDNAFAGYFTDGTYTAYLGDSANSVAGYFDDGVAIETKICDGTYGVNTTGGIITTGIIQANNAIYFTQTDGNEAIDSLNDGYMDYGATTAHRFNTPVRSSTASYRRYYHLPVDSFNPGASGATWTSADANHRGGWRLNASTETLEFGTDVHSDWDGASDLTIELHFALNVAGNPGDTVDLRLQCFYNGDGDIVTKTQVLEEAVTTDGTQYKVYQVTFTINWDETDNNVEVGDAFGFILNLETDTSEIDDAILLQGNSSYFYNTTHTGIESGDT